MIVERQSIVDAPSERVWARVVTSEGINAELRPGRRFDEQSTMLSMRRWRHERTLEPDGDAKTDVRDRLTFELRPPIRLLTPVMAVGIGALFSHRQRRLQRHFGGR